MEIGTYFDYSDYQYKVRTDLPDAYRLVWQKISQPGNWWRGDQRVAIANEVRAARHCRLCSKRKTALSPFAITGTHESVSDLPDNVIDVVHRLCTDASRLTRKWLDESSLSKELYVELLGIVVAVISIDGFHRALGFPLENLPVPQPGEPDGYRPPGAMDGHAWVPIVTPASIGEREADLYDGSKQTGNVVSAMSLVPDSVRLLKLLSGVQYLSMHDVPNPATNGGRAISRAHIELLAGRVSALSECFY